MRRVVVTGLGIVSPVGCGVEAAWSALLAGKSGARKVEEFEVSDIASQIACFIPKGDGSDGTYNANDCKFFECTDQISYCTLWLAQ